MAQGGYVREPGLTSKVKQLRTHNKMMGGGDEGGGERERDRVMDQEPRGGLWGGPTSRPPLHHPTTRCTKRTSKKGQSLRQTATHPRLFTGWVPLMLKYAARAEAWYAGVDVWEENPPPEVIKAPVL